jgi:hypothetical protein
MMQWIDRLCLYESFGAKLLKTELRLKSYKVLKLQRLNCKITGARY